MASMDQIKELRDRTGISVMQCGKALEEAGGDMEKAIIILRKKGADAASKKQDRDLGAGIVKSYVHSTGSVGTLVELRSETDFVAKNPEFGALAYDIAMHIAAANPSFITKDEINEDAKNLAKEVFIKEVEGKPEEMKEMILKAKIDAYFGEKVLLDQPFIKNPDMTVQNLIEAAIQKFGERIEIGKFSRFDVTGK
jgi:elongation factor Ts